MDLGGNGLKKIRKNYYDLLGKTHIHIIEQRQPGTNKKKWKRAFNKY